MGRQCHDLFPNFFQDVQKVQNLLFSNVFIRGTLQENLLNYSLWVIYDHDRLSKQQFFPQSAGARYKSRTSCLQDLFGHWVMPTEAWPILNQMAVGQQIPAGLHCIIQLFWTHAPAVSELAAAIELLLPPICTQCIERLLQPCPHCLSSILP